MNKIFFTVLMSEVIKFYYPHMVNSHHYIPGNSIKNKRDNWDTLNRRVLDKINMHLSPETIDQLIHSQSGAIEKLLSDFKDKQMSLEATIKESEFKVFDTEGEYPENGFNLLMIFLKEVYSISNVFFFFFFR